MRRWILAALVVVSSALGAAEPDSDRRERVRVRLEDGQVVEGRIVRWGVQDAVVDVGIGVDLTVKRAQVERVPAVEAQNRPLMRLKLFDGRTFHGYVVEQDRHRVVLELPRGGRLDTRVEAIRELVEVRNPRPELWADEQLPTEAPPERVAEPEVIARAEPRPPEPPPPPPPPPEVRPPPAPTPAPPPPVFAERRDAEETPAPPQEVVTIEAPPEVEREARQVATLEEAEPEPKPEKRRRKRKRKKEPEPPPRPDPYRTRYFVAPSAFTLEVGEGYFAQKEVLYTHFALGVSESLQLEFGSVLPAWLAGPSGLNLVAGAKWGFRLRDNLRIAATLYAVSLPLFATVALPTVTMTTGSEDAHLSLSVTVPIALHGFASLPHAAFNASGSLRVGRGFALITENYLFFAAGFRTHAALAAGFRVFSDHLAFGLGAMLVNPGAQFGSGLVPYLDFTYRWDKP